MPTKRCGPVSRIQAGCRGASLDAASTSYSSPGSTSWRPASPVKEDRSADPALLTELLRDRWGSRWSSPPLTTVRQPLAQMGMVAARAVIRLMHGEDIESPKIELATELIVRESTAPPTTR